MSDLSTAISRKRCKIGGKLVLITNRKSYMSFRLVPKSLTLNDLEWRNGRYFALFQRIRVAFFRGALRKSSRSLSHLRISSCLRFPVTIVLHLPPTSSVLVFPSLCFSRSLLVTSGYLDVSSLLHIRVFCVKLT